jgi:hypothetical protein
MSVLARIHNRFFAFRSMSPTRRCITPGSGPHHRRERLCRQFLGSAFSVQQLAQRLALTGAAIDVATPSWNSHERHVGRTPGLDGILHAVVGGAGSDPALFDRLRGQWSDDVAMAPVLAEDGHGTLVADGRTVSVEFTTVGSATSAVGHTEGGAQVALQPTRTVARGRTQNVLTVTLAIGPANAAQARSQSIADMSAPLKKSVSAPAKNFYPFSPLPLLRFHCHE